MRTIKEIAHVERMLDKDNVPFYRTYAIMDDGTECVGFSRERNAFDLEDSVEVFHDPEFDVIKMRHNKNEPSRIELENA